MSSMLLVKSDIMILLSYDIWFRKKLSECARSQRTRYWTSTLMHHQQVLLRAVPKGKAMGLMKSLTNLEKPHMPKAIADRL
jgi:hypothetical protein